MGVLPRRASYRAGQFFRALRAGLKLVDEAGLAAARTVLPAAAYRLFTAMPRADQRHSLAVLSQLRDHGQTHPALQQAALLHDVAKAGAGLTLLHRVAVVLLKELAPDALARWADGAEPGRGSLRYPFWAQAHHPELGARLAAGAGCDPLAAELIRRHQDPVEAERGDGEVERLLAALQAADEDH